jgi:hypothetical protein
MKWLTRLRAWAATEWIMDDPDPQYSNLDRNSMLCDKCDCELCALAQEQTKNEPA